MTISKKIFYCQLTLLLLSIQHIKSSNLLIDQNLSPKIGNLKNEEYSNLLSNSINPKTLTSKQQTLASVSLTPTTTSSASPKTPTSNILKLPDINSDHVNGMIKHVNQVEDNSDLINFLSETQDLDGSSPHRKMNKIDFYLKLKGFPSFFIRFNSQSTPI